jgi:hypothetical protein
VTISFARFPEVELLLGPCRGFDLLIDLAS